ncbi:MAG TPA: DnaA N-terminal domain-containing protein, partial [Candidatus Baltobacteraceae bacterium]|nr:DnaA N-terminal domain-containing protein [Candidatus Baltobacteraceae bacterium]
MALAVGNPDISSDLWQSALDALERKFSKPIFEMWIKPLRLVSLSGDELRLAVQNNFARDWVENRLKGQIYEVLAEIFGTGVQLQFTVLAETAEVAQSSTASLATPAVPGRPQGDFRPGNLNSRYTFEEFVIGNSNRFAHA